MASMILTPEQSDEEAAEMAPASYKPRYAVSSMYLDGNALEALGFTEPLKAGTVVRFTGQALVTDASVRPEADGDVEIAMSLQPTELTVAPAGKSAQAMFPNSEMEE